MANYNGLLTGQGIGGTGIGKTPPNPSLGFLNVASAFAPAGTTVPQVGDNGNVLGASTSQQPVVRNTTPAPAPAPAGPSPEQLLAQQKADAAAQNQKLIDQGTSSINSGYDAFTSGLDKLAGTADEQAKPLYDQVESLFGTNQGVLQSQEQGALQNLDLSKSQAQSQTQSALRDTASNLRNAMDAAARKFGVANSSAAGQYGFALSKLSAQERTKILNQASQIYAQIDQKKSDVERTFDEQAQQLLGWRNNERLKIASQVQQYIQQLDQEKLTANKERAQAITNLQLQIGEQTSQALQNIDAQATSWAQQLAAWREQRVNQYATLQSTLSTGAQQVINPASIGTAGQYSAPSIQGPAALSLGQ